MGVIEFSEYYKQAVQAGQAVEGNVVKLFADNGQEIGDGVFTVIKGGNGASANFWNMVKAGVSGAITTGMSFMSVSLPTFFAAVAPTLGIVAGTSIYQIMANDPGFENRLLQALYENGKTIGGNVITYFNGDNTFWDKEAIEIVKNLMYEDGIFRDPFPDSSQTGTVRVESYMDPLDFADYLMTRRAFTFAEGVRNSFIAAVGGHPDYIPFGRVYMGTNSFQGLSPLTVYLYPYSDIVTIGGTNPNTIAIQTYGRWSGGIQPFIITDVVTGSASGVPLTIGQKNEGDYIVASGLNTISNAYVQPGATLPSDEDISITYPSWIPWDYPIPDPSGLPDLYPAKYPGTGDDPYPEQGPAQNPLPESIPDTYPIIIPNLPLPTPTPINVPEVDPEPMPDPEDIPDNTPDPSRPDPTDPNPDPIPTPVVPISPLPSTVDSNKLFTVYNPTQSQIDSLGGYLWDSDLMEILKKIWQDPLDGVISLSQVYVTPPTSGSHNIILGYLDSGVSSAVVSNQFVTVDCGSVQLKETKENATDYTPYTALSIYLPFIGITELDVNECMGATINVTYKVDLYTGTCLATIKITRTEDLPNGGILYTYNGNCAQQIPLTSGNASGLLTGLLSAVGSGLAVATGGGAGLVAGLNLAGQTLNHEMLHVSHSGNISANAGIMGNKKPYLIISRTHGYDANSYNTFYGYPANKNVFIGNCSGYIRVKDCHIQSSANDNERAEIERLLKAGVIV